MEPNIWLGVWIALAVILALAELFSADFFVLPFAIGAAVAAVLEFLLPGSINLQWVAFFGVSSLLLITVQRVRARRAGSPRED